MSFEKGDKKVINAWCWYDWANSVYPLVITTAVFPIYFSAVTSANGNDTINVLGKAINNNEFYSYLVSLSFVLVAMISPVLSGIADYAGKKRTFMQIFSTMGAIGALSLFFFTSRDNLWIGIGGSVLASIGFAGSIVFYNAFLPEIVEESRMDMVSARGFTMGYIGSSILLILCFIVISTPATFGIVDAAGEPDKAMATRLSFVMSGVWWLGFAQISFAGLPNNIHGRKASTRKLVRHGYRELMAVLHQIRQPEQRRILWFLLAFFFFALGYMTVIYLAALFGKIEIGLEDWKLMLTVLIIQFVAIGGSYLFAFLSKKFGNIRALVIATLVWTCICGTTYFVETEGAFYVIAFFVGTVMGGIQALARSTYAKLLPETQDHASYYSFYELTEKVATAVGTLFYGLIIALTGSMRNSTLFLGSMFLVGMVFLLIADRKQSH
ncbi:MAG: MFS transporter [Bacteroidota bacterium]